MTMPFTGTRIDAVFFTRKKRLEAPPSVPPPIRHESLNCWGCALAIAQRFCTMLVSSQDTFSPIKFGRSRFRPAMRMPSGNRKRKEVKRQGHHGMEEQRMRQCPTEMRMGSGGCRLAAAGSEYRSVCVVWQSRLVLPTPQSSEPCACICGGDISLEWRSSLRRQAPYTYCHMSCNTLPTLAQNLPLQV